MNVKNLPQKDNSTIAKAFTRLYGLVGTLRGPAGCAWDREQTPSKLKANLLEEVYECIAAIEDGDDQNLEEELGDLFLILVMITKIKEEEGAFSLGSSLNGIYEKLVRRHPHVFGDSDKNSIPEILKQWDEIKAREKGGNQSSRGSILAKIPSSLPPLALSQYIQKKVGKVGFDWDDLSPVFEKLTEEMDEIKEAIQRGNGAEIESELGDLLFTLVNVCRFLNVDPSLALNGTNIKFVRRFKELERRMEEQNISFKKATLAEMDTIWSSIKEMESTRQREKER